MSHYLFMPTKAQLLSIFCIVAVSWYVLFPGVNRPLAQTTESSSTSADLVFTKTEVADQITDVQKTYRAQLDTYRTAEKQYQIAKAQYQQLNTLIALESAVKATHEAMIARDDVLKSYVTLLRLLLIQTEGINLDQKNPTIDSLAELSSKIDAHHQEVEQANDRYSLATAANNFEDQATSLQGLVYKTLSLLAVGKLQTIYDQALALSQDMDQVVLAAGNDVKQGERQRALTEISKQLESVKTDLTPLNSALTADINNFNQTSYTKETTDLQTVYSGLAKALSFMAELLRI